MSFIQHQARLSLATLAALLISAAAHAGFGNEAFEDDPSAPQEDSLEWPDITFPSADERGAGFRAGERLEYRAQWGLFRKAGKIVIETEALPGNTDGKLRVKTLTASSGLIRAVYPMTLNASTVLDPQNWRMEHNQVDGKTRSEPTKTVTRVDYDNKVLVFEDAEEPERNKVRQLPYDFPLDYSSSLLQLRGYDLEIGKTFPLFVSSKGKFYYVEMEVVALEPQHTKLGDRQCYRLEPSKAFPESKLFREGGKMAIWVTNDPQRIPVRFDVKTSVGTATIRLDRYQSSPEGNLASF